MYRIALALALAGTLSCGSSPVASTPPPTFIAFGEDFAAYRTWSSFEITVDAAPGNDHLVGPRRVFYNQLPPPGSTAFPVGTILVKESGDGDLPTRHVFAMVKRGGGFNAIAGGALDWEWFELVNDTSGNVIMLWRGEGPPNGDAYGSGTTGGCNACHGGAPKTNYVFSPELTKNLAR
ncbi:hypothetical protein BH09MYX1_BH09MYX1_31890 [soil metagenome]